MTMREPRVYLMVANVINKSPHQKNGNGLFNEKFLLGLRYAWIGDGHVPTVGNKLPTYDAQDRRKENISSTHCETRIS